MEISTNDPKVAAIIVAWEMTKQSLSTYNNWSAELLRAEYIANMQSIQDAIELPERRVQNPGNEDIYIGE